MPDRRRISRAPLTNVDDEIRDLLALHDGLQLRRTAAIPCQGMLALARFKALHDQGHRDLQPDQDHIASRHRRGVVINLRPAFDHIGEEDALQGDDLEVRPDRRKVPISQLGRESVAGRIGIYPSQVIHIDRRMLDRQTFQLLGQRGHDGRFA
jgi:hypothetical protein